MSATKSIHTEIEIQAPISKVWEILMDFEKYPEWNPFIKELSGSTLEGDYLEVTMLSGGNKPMQFNPIVLINEEQEEFRWKGKLFVEGLFDGEHYFILEDFGNNQTRFIQGEEFTGLLSGALMKMIGKDTKIGFEAMRSLF